MSDVLMTGFPGFLGSALLPQAMARRPRSSAHLLVQSRYLDQAEERLEELTADHPHLAGRVHILEGDITLPDLGLSTEIIDGVQEVFHLAAVYDLAVPAEVAHRVNVDGTRNVVDVCQRARKLRRLQYVSTCYVSGSYPGRYREEELDVGQEFQNHYEQTKFEAEKIVRQAMSEGLPATIYRPGIVVGDSQTGHTQKYDGPYFLARFLMKQPQLAAVPQVADPDRVVFSMVPRDYVIAAIQALSLLPDAEGRTYALTDPEAPTVRELVDTFCQLLGKKPVWIPLPERFAEAAVGLPGMERLVGFPKQSIPYFALPTIYDTTNATTDLEPLGITCPRFADYAPAMIDFVRRNPDISSGAMV